MSEFSLFWLTGTTGDGASTYTDTQLFSWLRRTFNSDMFADRGPLRGYNGELAVTAGTGKVTVATGAAYVYGIPYENDAALDVAIPTPTSNTRIDRIVLRASWSAKTVRITRIAGTEGAGAPAITQNPGTTYDVKLAQVSITTGGAITVTDERQFCRFATEVTTENIADGAITAAKISGGAVDTSMLADGAVTDAKIAGVSGSKVSGAVASAASAGNADTVDGAHAGNAANNVLKLDTSGLVPLGNIPANLTGKNADTVDGAHAGTGADNVLKLDAAGKVPYANLPAAMIIPLGAAHTTDTGGPAYADSAEIIWRSAYAWGKSVYFEAFIRSEGTDTITLTLYANGSAVATLTHNTTTKTFKSAGPITIPDGATLTVLIDSSGGNEGWAYGMALSIR